MIRDLTEGAVIQVQLFIERAEERIGKRGPYTSVTFTDGEAEGSANIWCPVSQFPYQGEVVDAELTMRNGYVNILNATKAISADISKYVVHAPIDEGKCFQMVCDAIQKITDLDIRNITTHAVLENEDKFKKWAAAKSAHHNYLNGLLYHVCRMLAGVKTVSAIYNLDEELMTAGVILHDIGKLSELNTDDMGITEFTKEGHLFGHLYLGAELINTICRKYGIDPGKEKVMCLKHMLLSHHDLPEHGAVKMPATKEAYALSILDLLDSKMWIYEKEYEQLEKGTFGGAVRLLDGRHIYRPVNDS